MLGQNAALTRDADRRDSLRLRLGVVAATICGNLFLVLGSAVLGAVATVSGWIPPRRFWPRLMARIWARGLLISSGVRLRVEGTEQLAPASASYVVMSNHTSSMDIPVLIASFPGDLAFVAKRELFRIPLFGWGMRAAGFIPVDRSDRSRAAEVVHGAVGHLTGGESVVVFPEETRSPDGRLLPFKRGGFLMAIRAQHAVLPVGIRGSFTVRRKRGITVHPGTVEVHYGEPVEVTSRSVRQKAELMAQVRQAIGRLAAVESVAESEPESGKGAAGRSGPAAARSSA
jgi:1-acyl-sn-glycerol-3-phosphate acyltransferase